MLLLESVNHFQDSWIEETVLNILLLFGLYLLYSTRIWVLRGFCSSYSRYFFQTFVCLPFAFLKLPVLRL
ncbi:hypothetical protein Hanom_Chr17g01549871 [Helianthus anomalus]